MKSFVKNVAATLTPESLSSLQILTNSCKVKAKSTNTGSVFIGDDITQVYELKASEEVSITEIFEKDGGSADIDIKELFCKVSTNGDGVCVIYADRTNPLNR